MSAEQVMMPGTPAMGGRGSSRRPGPARASGRRRSARCRRPSCRRSSWGAGRRPPAGPSPAGLRESLRPWTFPIRTLRMMTRTGCCWASASTVIVFTALCGWADLPAATQIAVRCPVANGDPAEQHAVPAHCRSSSTRSRFRSTPVEFLVCGRNMVSGLRLGRVAKPRGPASRSGPSRPRPRRPSG